jgi:hypothetical protein
MKLGLLGISGFFFLKIGISKNWQIFPILKNKSNFTQEKPPKKILVYFS